MLGLDGLGSFLLKNRELPISDLLDGIYDYGLRYSEKQSFDDDITLLGLELKR